ncbi:TPA: hypothetical protein HA235_06105 [Candidatus Woesearchaeota archaeon]|nr:hypothetical protein [Candidatus Woesearchaeota archaeon]HIH32253.1 hypothetical protein [Candidatus Woesearchaeota archaeon]HIH54789.1 hypothetical protein [Candidatus Woesearchaeota archaeon]HIJ01365.1 hypothetical protein [Candidatus Woesearchaeota archaeon]HIJ14415.1 hypothetical protein [Candidatus Woesearchaeota archaeon]
MKLSGLLVVGIVGVVAIVFMLFSVGIFSDGGITGKVTGVCNSFSVDSDSGFFVKGSSVVSGCVAASVSDFCLNPCVVGEYVGSSLIHVNCLYGCVNGACLQQGANPSLAEYCADKVGGQDVEDCDNGFDDDNDGDTDCDDADCESAPNCVVEQVCGNGKIEEGERVSTCPADVNYLSTRKGHAPLGSGITYYVKTDGDNNKDGKSLANAWKTIGKANTVLQPGDSVIISSGTYTGPITPDNNGSSESTRITFRAAPGANVIINGGWGADLTGKSYITVSGINMNAAHYVQLSHSNHIIVENGEFIGTYSNPGIQMRSTSYAIIRNNKVVGYNDGYQDLIEIVGSSHHNLIEHNRLEQGSHTCLIMNGNSNYNDKDPNHNIIRSNYFLNDWHHCINDQIGVNYNLFEGNFFAKCGSGDKNSAQDTRSYSDSAGDAGQWQSQERYGIARFNTVMYSGERQAEAAAFGASGGGNTIPRPDGYQDYVGNAIYHNVFYMNYDKAFNLGIYYRPAGNDLGTYRDNIFKNNILYANGIDPHASGEVAIGYFRYWAEGNSVPPYPSGDVWANNIIENVNEKILDYTHNEYTLSQASAVSQLTFSQNIGGDPRFANPSSHDFSLQATSPAINAGVCLTTVKTSGSGTSVVVIDARYFIDGWGIVGPDMIQIGNDVVNVTAVNYDSDVLTVSRSISYSAGECVSFPYSGPSPDIGVYEYK